MKNFSKNPIMHRAKAPLNLMPYGDNCFTMITNSVAQNFTKRIRGLLFALSFLDSQHKELEGQEVRAT